MVFNAFHDLVHFILPAYDASAVWTLVIDTNLPEAEGEPMFPAGNVYAVTGRSLLLFELKADQAPPGGA